MAGVGGAHAAQRSCSGTRGMRQQGSCRQAMHQSPCKGPRARQVGATAIVDFGRVGVGCFTVASDSRRRRRFYGVIAMSSIILSEIPNFGRKSNRQRETLRIACARTPWHSHFNRKEAILRPRPCPGGPRPHTSTCPPRSFCQQRRVFFLRSAALLRC